jgi:hypothetical protein
MRANPRAYPPTPTTRRPALPCAPLPLLWLGKLTSDAIAVGTDDPPYHMPYPPPTLGRV